jgi:large subunit ribosomal protein L28
MARRCQITGKGPMSGNNVSHANNKTRRRFLPSVQDSNLYSEVLKIWIKVRSSAHGMRSIEHKGGLDAYLESTAKTKLDPALRTYKARIEKAKAEKAA